MLLDPLPLLVLGLLTISFALDPLPFLAALLVPLLDFLDFEPNALPETPTSGLINETVLEGEDGIGIKEVSPSTLGDDTGLAVGCFSNS